MAWVRHLVSKKKRRYIEDGYDLDLTCIFFAAINKVSQIGKGWGRSNFRCVVDVVSLNYASCPSTRDGHACM